MTSPGELALTVYRGDDYTHTLTFYSDEAQTTPINLSGRTYLAQIRKSANSPDVLATFTVDTTNAATGVLVLRLTATVAATLNGTASWDLQETASGVVTTVLRGAVTVTSDVSRT